MVRLFASSQEAIDHIRHNPRPYDMLKLGRGCGEKAVHTAYRNFSLFVHPDRSEAAGAIESTSNHLGE